MRAVERGDYAPVKHLLENPEGAELATFLHHSIQCSEELPQNDLARAEADLFAFPAFGPTSVYDLLAAQCEAFGLAPEEDAEPAWHGRVQPLEQSLPVLALTGRYDPLSVAGHWTEAAFTLPEGSLFELPAAGHDARNSACGAELVARFLERPANDLPLPRAARRWRTSSSSTSGWTEIATSADPRRPLLPRALFIRPSHWLRARRSGCGGTTKNHEEPPPCAAPCSPRPPSPARSRWSWSSRSAPFARRSKSATR